jgi:apolipoprotein N-acyltransferase
MKQNKAIHLVIQFTLGVVLAGAAELPLGGWLQIPILGLIFWQLSKSSATSLKNHLAAAMSFALGYFVCGLWWIYISLHDVGGMNAMLSGAAVFLLSSYTSIFFVLACLPIFYFRKSPILGLILGASWVLAEYVRNILFTGFPWLGLAETQVHGPFASIAPYLGGLGCTFFVVLSAWQLLHLRKNRRGLAIFAISITALAQLPALWAFTKPSGEPLSVELIQGNFSQHLIFSREGMFRQIQFYENAMINSQAQLVVSPETSLPWPEMSLPLGTLDNLQNLANHNNSTLLFGVIGRHENPPDGREFSNRALGLGDHSPPYRYDKSHLVPFGEFIPPGFRWFVNAFSVPLSDFARGPINQPLFRIARQGQEPLYAAITICYEDVFGGELATRLRNSEEEANLLINMTNLAWFGASQAPTQQLRLSQLRSLETGLPALRATNTGVTAVLGPDGKVLAQLPQFTQGTLSAKLQPYRGKTPYVRWGNAPILSLACLLLVLGFIRQKRF